MGNFVNENGYTPLHYASHYGNKESCKIFVLKGADVNAESKRGITPLMLAANRGHVEVVRLLLQFGADTKVSTDYAKPNCVHVIKHHEAKVKKRESQSNERSRRTTKIDSKKLVKPL